MAEVATQTKEIWDSVLRALGSDERITPQLRGFLGLVEPKGVMAGTMYLEVPNDFTRGMLEQRMRQPLLRAIGSLDPALEIQNFAGVVNRDMGNEPAARVGEPLPAEPYIEAPVPSA